MIHTPRKLLTAIVLSIMMIHTSITSALECMICYDEYSKDTIVVQFDCGQKVTHHTCLTCAEQLVKNHLNCPSCRAHLRLHNPQVTHAPRKIHHLYRDLTPQEQGQLNTVLAQASRSPRQMPDHVERLCSSCDEEHHDTLMIHYTCGHANCLPTAVNHAESGHRTCPVCKEHLELVDPLIQHNGQQQLRYQYRRPTANEQSFIEKLRSYLPLYQEHIPGGQRVPAIHLTPPLPIIDTTITGPFSPEQKALNNAHLPQEPKTDDWHVLETTPGTYARARKAKPQPRTTQRALPPSRRRSPDGPPPHTSVNSHVVAGFLCGFLAGPKASNLNKKRRALSIPALLYSGFTLYKSYESDTRNTLKDLGSWTIGAMVGIFASYSAPQSRE